MKILFLSDDFPPESFGGAGISTYELAVGMKTAGHEVFVVTTCRSRADAGASEHHGLKIFKIASDYPGKWRWYVSLNNRPVVQQVEVLLKNIAPDMVHVNNIHLYLSYRSIRVAKRYAKVVVWTARDVMAFNFSKLQTERYLKNFDCRTTWRDHLKQAKKRWNPLRNFFVRRYLGYANKLYAVSDALANALEQNRIKGVAVMHSGADIDAWRVDETGANRFREKYNLRGKKVILFSGRLSEAKGGQQTLEAIAKIAKSLSDVVLLVISKIDGYAEYLKKEAEKLGIRNELIFTGWVEREEIKYAYACADLVLVPSICFDSFPRIVLEAMAAGRPVVGTCFGGASEIIADGVTGYVVNPFNIEKMAEKILDILNDPQKKERFGNAGRERVETDFNSRDKVNMLLADYRELLERLSPKK